MDDGSITQPLTPAAMLVARPEAGHLSLVITEGATDEFCFLFRLGVPTAPFGVGSHGQWRVIADGVAPVHIFLSYDGRALFGATAIGVAEARVNGERLGTRWVELPMPCVVAFGSARMSVTLSPGANAALPEAPRPAPPAAPTRSPLFDVFTEETIVDPFLLHAAVSAADEAAAERGNHRVAPTSAPTLATPRQPEGRAMPLRHPVREALQAFRRLPRERRLLVALAPVGILAVSLLMKDGPSPSRSDAKATAGSRGSEPARAALPVEPAASAPALRTTQNDAPVLDFRAIGDDGKTLERLAVDAVARGAFTEATSLYAKLATQHPGARVYGEAARIAGRKQSQRP